MTDQDIWRLNRGGHDPHKVYAAYHSAMQNTGTPTVILAKTIKACNTPQITIYLVFVLKDVCSFNHFS